MDNTTNSAVEKKALSRVPKEQRQSWYSIAFIWIGTMICIPMLMVGGLLSASMTFGNVLLACFLGFAICSVLMIMVGMQGTDLGLPSSMCGTKAFGDRGSSYLLSGSWFSLGDVRLGQGKDAAKEYFRQNPEAAATLEKNVRENFHKLMGNQSKIAARAAGRAVDVSADDFDDSDE